MSADTPIDRTEESVGMETEMEAGAGDDILAGETVGAVKGADSNAEDVVGGLVLAQGAGPITCGKHAC